MSNSLELSLWRAANELRTNSNLDAHEYMKPVLGLIFLKCAERSNFINTPEKATFSYIKEHKSGLGTILNKAMMIIEENNNMLKNSLPKMYDALDDSVLASLINLLDSIAAKKDKDFFGQIYEYFLGKFALMEGRNGGEYYTPSSIVKLICAIIKPKNGKLLDPACGSGGMFVQALKNTENLEIFGQEKSHDSINVCKMNLAAHGSEGTIVQGNSYYESKYDEKFDFVMANPPFNAKQFNADKLKKDYRYKYGIPNTNANYLWIQIFINALNETGRAGFVMSNIAADASYTELDIRKKIIKDRLVDIIISVGPNFFYNATLGCMLWFIDKSKSTSDRADDILFIDATGISVNDIGSYKKFSKEQISRIAEVVESYRDGIIDNLPNFCKITKIKEVAKKSFSLNPRKYIIISNTNFSEKKLNSIRNDVIAISQNSKNIEDSLLHNIEGVIENKKFVAQVPSMDIFTLSKKYREIYKWFPKILFHKWFELYNFPGADEINFKKTKMGVIPSNFKIVNLADIVDFIKGIEPGRKNYKDYSPKRLKFIRVGDIGTRPSDIWIEKDIVGNKILMPKDIVLTLDATIGLVATGLYGSYASGIRKLVIKDCSKINKTFLFYLLQSDYIQNTITSYGKGTTIQHASSVVNNFKCVIPPLDLQNSFANIVSPIIKF